MEVEIGPILTIAGKFGLGTIGRRFSGQNPYTVGANFLTSKYCPRLLLGLFLMFLTRLEHVTHKQGQKQARIDLGNWPLQYSDFGH